MDAISASSTAGRTATCTAPACATSVQSFVNSGAGGYADTAGLLTVDIDDYPGQTLPGLGYSEHGYLSVTPGQRFFAVAGSMGGVEAPGLSYYANGGRGQYGAGGGGGASALYRDGDLLTAVGAGGGAGPIFGNSAANNKFAAHGGAYGNDGGAGGPANPSASKGFAGNSQRGCDGALGAAYPGPGNPHQNRGGGGGGGGGYVGSGGGAANYWNTNDGSDYSTGSGGDGGDHHNVDIVGANSTAFVPGSVTLIFY